MVMLSERYHEVCSALSGAKDKRAVHDYSSTSWCRTANRAISKITAMDSEVASISWELLYVPTDTVLLLDGDHVRIVSRAVLNLTYLQQHNNPKAVLVLSATHCALLPISFLSVHFIRIGGNFRHIYKRLSRPMQGASTNGDILPMLEAIFAADRDHNSKDTIQF